ncbi:CD209 antigen-like [Drosophila subpulchrella]|uniref:CD209 antigen-like n=1 Tax=Drosophila subpulchrella TaxID=1486046 RepID=UPI0018A13C81|nr:CD209 antigen-like [Drosophila subpulchrella]
MLQIKAYFWFAFIAWNINGFQAKSVQADYNRKVSGDLINKLVVELFPLLDLIGEQCRNTTSAALKEIKSKEVTIERRLNSMQSKLEGDQKSLLETVKSTIPENLKERLAKMEGQQTSVQGTLKKIPQDFEERLDRMEKQQTDWHSKMEEELKAVHLKLEGLQKLLQPRVPPKFELIGSRHFYIDRVDRDWTSARNHCHEMGGYLASIKDEEELHAIAGKLQDHNRYRLGINDRETLGTYLSDASGYEAPFLNWRSGEPNHNYHHDKSRKDERCVELIDGEMNDVPCFLKMFTICQADNKY